MALNIALQPLGPGQALLQVAGVDASIPERIAIALQRNDGRWLGSGRQWQVTPHWHPMFTAEAIPGGIQLLLGAELVDSIIGVGGSPLQVALRRDDATDAGVLRIRGALIGSDAAADRQRPDDVEKTAIVESVPRPHPEGTAEAAPSPQKEQVAPEQPPSAPTPAHRRRLWPWIMSGAVLLLAGVGIGLWWLGFPDRLGPPFVDTPPGTETPPPETEPKSDPQAPLPTEASGVELARSFLSGGPDMDAVFARAQKAEQAGDCAAAFALYSEAANRDAGLAARLARRYDPLTHTPGPCIEKPDAPYAIVYFKDAAEAGDPAIQRRLGQLMVERESAGPTHEAGLQWLRRAAQSGDSDATEILERIGGR